MCKRREIEAVLTAERVAGRLRPLERVELSRRGVRWVEPRLIATVKHFGQKDANAAEDDDDELSLKIRLPSPSKLGNSIIKELLTAPELGTS